MIYKPTLFFALACALALPALAQWDVDADGIEAGPLVLRPSSDVTAAYDNRVLRASTGKGAKSDFYSDVAAGAELANRPARYNLALRGRYGYRAHARYDNLNDDFYTLGASIKTDAKPLIWALSTDYSKSLDYNTTYNPATGQEPDNILTDRTNTRLNSRANLAYDSNRFARTALVPSYTFQHYYQEFEDQPNEESFTHTGILKLRYQHSSKTQVYGGLVYSLQSRREEDGRIFTPAVGVNHRTTDKTSLVAELGYSLANYDSSGEDQGFVSNLRGNWQTTPKVSTYVFGGNSFQPGYGGGAARMVYRLGYGAKWQIRQKYSLAAALLHDYQEPIGNNTAPPSANSPYNTLRNFIDIKMQYNPYERLALAAGLRHNADEYEPSRNIVSLRAVYRFY